jgi:hypothetical protein
LNRDIALIGSKGLRGRKAYTPNLNHNLFQPLEPNVRLSYEKGDGSEIISVHGNPAKMQAVHSSSALSVNIFQYWQKIGQVPLIAAVCGFCRKGNNISHKIVFEDKNSISKKFRYPPNIDVVIYNSESAKIKRFAVECKFSEAYSTRGEHGLKTKYMDIESLWIDIPHTHNLAKSICPNDKEFRHLHPAQLVKHILGLKRKFGKSGFRLLYLWYDVLGKEGAVHRKEIEAFTEVVRSDDIKFHELTYQELIVKLTNEYRSNHYDYIKYISDRYL